MYSKNKVIMECKIYITRWKSMKMSLFKKVCV